MVVSRLSWVQLFEYERYNDVPLSIVTCYALVDWHALSVWLHNIQENRHQPVHADELPETPSKASLGLQRAVRMSLEWLQPTSPAHRIHQQVEYIHVSNWFVFVIEKLYSGISFYTLVQTRYMPPDASSSNKPLARSTVEFTDSITTRITQVWRWYTLNLKVYVPQVRSMCCSEVELFAFASSNETLHLACCFVSCRTHKHHLLQALLCTTYILLRTLAKRWARNSQIMDLRHPVSNPTHSPGSSSYMHCEWGSRSWRIERPDTVVYKESYVVTRHVKSAFVAVEHHQIPCVIQTLIHFAISFCPLWPAVWCYHWTLAWVLETLVLPISA